MPSQAEIDAYLAGYRDAQAERPPRFEEEVEVPLGEPVPLATSVTKLGLSTKTLNLLLRGRDDPRGQLEYVIIHTVGELIAMKATDLTLRRGLADSALSEIRRRLRVAGHKLSGD